jgi:hypothetical protein
VNGGPILTITWNHSSSDLAKAVAAKLVIEDGKGSREVPIGGDELRLGTIEYRHVSDEVKITFVVNMPGSITISQSVDWRGAGS